MFSRFYILIVVSLTTGFLVAPAVSEDLSPRQSFSGTATFFFQNGNAGACGQVHRDDDHIVALKTETYANGVHCGSTITITDEKTGVTTTGVVADECPTCDGPSSIDLSHGLFNVFAPDGEGTFPVSWHF